MQPFLREVRRTGHGSLVLVGSTAGRFGEAGHADYAAAKAAVQVGLLLSLKNEIVRIAPRGRVNAVAPGMTDTPLPKAWFAEQADPQSCRAGVEATIPQRRLATPDDVASAVLFLASDKSASTTGSVVTTDGGVHV